MTLALKYFEMVTCAFPVGIHQLIELGMPFSRAFHGDEIPAEAFKKLDLAVARSAGNFCGDTALRRKFEFEFTDGTKLAVNHDSEEYRIKVGVAETSASVAQQKAQIWTRVD